MASQVARYSLGWNPKRNVGAVFLELDNGRTLRMQFDTAAEFTAVAAVLREADVFVDNKGYVYTGAEISEAEE
jgi:hypothetical protein